MLALEIDQVRCGLEARAQGFNAALGGTDNVGVVHGLEQRNRLVEPEHRAIDDELEVILGAVQTLKVFAVLNFLGCFGHASHQCVGLVGKTLGQSQVFFQGLAWRAEVNNFQKGKADVIRALHDDADFILDLLLGNQHGQLGVEHFAHGDGVGVVVALDIGNQGCPLRVRLGQCFELLEADGELFCPFFKVIAVGANVFFTQGVEAQRAEVGQLQQANLHLVDFAHHRHGRFVHALVGVADVVKSPQGHRPRDGQQQQNNCEPQGDFLIKTKL